MEMRECQKCFGLFPLSEFPICMRIESRHLWKCRKCAEQDKRLFEMKTMGRGN